MCALLLTASCIKDKDSVASSPYCAITSFSVGNITSNVSTTDASGNVTTTKRVYSGNSVFFSIDQQAGTITNVDALPSWITLNKVIPKFSSYGNVFQVIDSLYVGITSGVDSIDVSVPRRLACISSDGLYRKYYTLTLTNKPADADTIVWEKLSASDLQLSGSHHLLTVSATYADGDDTDSLVRRMLVFSEDAFGKPMVTSSTDGVSWMAPAVLTGADSEIDWMSVTLHRGRLYAIDDLGRLYTSSEADKGMTWVKVADTRLHRLLGSDGLYLYAYDGDAIVSSEDFLRWTEQGTDNLNMLPERHVYCFSRPSNTNSDMVAAMMGGLTQSNANSAVTWYKMTSATNQYNQPWSYIQLSGDNTHGLPRLEEMSTVYYSGCLYSIGRRAITDGTLKFEGIYCSEDNGIAWYLQSKKWCLPKDLEAADGPASMAIIGDTLYIVQTGGSVWKGVIK